MSWATPAEAQSITGVVLSQAELDVATNLLDIFVGVVDAARPNLSNRDLRLLMKAESYQAAWMKAQVDLLGRSDATLVSQDGLQYSKGDQDMHILGPLRKGLDHATLVDANPYDRPAYSPAGSCPTEQGLRRDLRQER